MPKTGLNNPSDKCFLSVVQSLHTPCTSLHMIHVTSDFSGLDAFTYEVL